MFSFDMNGDTFTVLNITDTQLNECHWDPGDPGYDNSYAVMDHTVRTLIDRVKPDLITITGDLSMADQPKAYPAFADYMDAFGIPWCAVWGNHEEQDVVEKVNFVYTFLPYYHTKKHFFHEDGDPAMGNGNYVITVSKDGSPVHALFMMDSHNCVWLPDEQGVKHFYYDKLNEAQIRWYRDQAAMLKQQGCCHSSMLLHIPIHAYRLAWEAAIRSDLDPKAVSLAQSYGTDCWNPGYEDSFGVGWEEVAAYPYDDGVFSAILDAGITQNVIAGHVHLHNTVIPYHGVNLAFATKTGKVHPWAIPLNGGTVLTIHADGSSRLHHEYVDVTHLLTYKDLQ
ncbi:MAG: metallophosphoesterase [Oscillospiraceae bacterium]|nr:metallophosphoesterase [Oscillospiraceae bacterium]